LERVREGSFDERFLDRAVAQVSFTRRVLLL
jgi:hypothetical protein